MSIRRLQVSNKTRARPYIFEMVVRFMFLFSSDRLAISPDFMNKDKYEHSLFFTDATLIGASITYVAGLFLLLSFAGPYWIESYPEMFSSFKHMGLWEYCFDRFRFPSYQFDKLFHGCHYIFSQVNNCHLKKQNILTVRVE